MSSLSLTPPAKYPFLGSASSEELGLLSKAIFEHLRYFTAPGKSFAREGADYVLYRPDFSEPEVALHCRAGGPPVVGLNDLRRFWEISVERGYSRAIFITNRSYSASAREFSRVRDLVAIDANDLESGLEDLSPRERLKVFRTYEYERGPQETSFFSSHIKALVGTVKSDLL